MASTKKRFLSGLLALVMTLSLLPVQAFAVEAEDTPAVEAEAAGPENSEPPEEAASQDGPEDGAPYYLMITHALEVDGEVYGKMETVQLTADDFRDGAYDFRQNALERQGMNAVRGSWLDNGSYDLTEGWTVAQDAFGEGGDFTDGSGYYGMQVLIEYEVAGGYEADVSNASGGAGDYDVMPLIQFTGGNLDDVEFTAADVLTLTIHFQYSRTGSLAGTAAYDTVNVEIPVEKDENGNYQTVSKEWAIPTDKTLENFRMLLNPYPLNSFLVDQELANRFSNPDTVIDDEMIKEALNSGAFNVRPEDVYSNEEQGAQGGYKPVYELAWDVARRLPEYSSLAELKEHIAAGHPGVLVPDADLEKLLQGGQADPHYSAVIVGKDENGADKEHPGASSVGRDATLRITLDGEDIRHFMDLKTGPEITVYYRRNATTYTAKHWVTAAMWSPSFGSMDSADTMKHGTPEVTYYLADTESLQGRVGALTNAAASDKEGFLPYTTEPIVQKLIERRANDQDEGTVVDVFYTTANNYRVIFNTNFAYISRQSVPVGLGLKLSNDNQLLVGEAATGDAYTAPTQAGYTFDGWMVKLKDTVQKPNPSWAGVSPEIVTIDSASDNPEQDPAGRYVKIDLSAGLTLTDAFLEDVQISQAEGDEGVRAVILYAHWTKGGSKVRVVLWTEDLNGKTDVSSTAIDGSEVVTSESWSNIGSFTFDCNTGTALTDGQGTVSNTVQVDGKSLSDKITEEFRKIDIMQPVRYTGADTSTGSYGSGTANEREVQISDFYTRHHATVTSSNGADNVTVAADGSTILYVYYTRNVYTLNFHYYKTENGANQIADNTNGYANTGTDNYNTSNSLRNSWKTVTSGTLPQQTITVRAKYGADLRGVWPIYSHGVSANNNTYNFVSWTTTKGPYNEIAKGLGLGISRGEPTIMGLYGAMSWQLIADAKNPETAHDLYAYWSNNLTYYVYNHCFEIPGLDANTLKGLPDSDAGNGFKKVLYNDVSASSAEASERNTLYLIPTANTAFTGPGFDDLREVDENGVPTVNGGYYAVRIYTFTPANSSSSVTKCYALSNRVEAASSAKIAMQNPSARLHLSKVNADWTNSGTTYPSVADHTTQFGHNDGSTGGQDTKPLEGNTATNRYDLYFYYDRDRYTITYMAALDGGKVGEGNATEYTLGTREVAYGTKLTGAEYGFKPGYTTLNNDQAYTGKWTVPADSAPVPVCPNRASGGQAQWAFNGWALGPAGNEWQWTYSGEAGSEVLTNGDVAITLEGDLLLYAIWGTPKYTVIFNLNGGTRTGTVPLTQQIDANTSITTGGQIPRPVRRNYTFKGWYETDTDGGTILHPDTPYNFDAPVTKSTYLKAMWDNTGTKQYAYQAYYLLPVEGNPGLPYPAGRFPAANGAETLYYILGRLNETDKDYTVGHFIAGSSLVLNAKNIQGFTPVNTDAAQEMKVEYSGSGTPDTIYKFYFYYTKNTVKTYKIQFVEWNAASGTAPVLTESGDADQAVLTPSAEMFEKLRNMGYQIVKADGTPAGSYKDLLEDGTLGSTDVNPDGSTVQTFQVKPIDYTITYEIGEPFTGTEVDATLKTAAETALAAITAAENTLPESAGEKNPTLYTVKHTITAKNPAYIQDSNGLWWQFAGWTLGGETTEGRQPAVRADGNSYNSLTIENSVGNLTFVANWSRVAPDLTVSKTVEQVSGVPAPADDEFSFTISGTLNSANILAYTTTAGSTGSSQASLTYAPGDTSADFTLKAGQTMNFVGLANETYTVTENTTGAQAGKFDATQNNYYTVKDGAMKTAAVGGGTAASVSFVNQYHATTKLDIDPDTAGAQSFRVIKHRLDAQGNHSDFLGGNRYSFTISRGEGNTAESVPLPSPSQITLNSTAGVQELSGFFSEIKFDHTGEYRYLIREDRPRAIDMVPGVTYDPTIYRVIVTVGIQDSNLAVTGFTLQTRQDDGTYQDAALKPGGILDSITFDNVYDPTSTTIHFEGRKELTGRTNPDGTVSGAQNGEFQFRLTAAGSYLMTAAASAKFHELKDAGDSANVKSYLMEKTYAADAEQPMPAETDNVKIETVDGQQTAVVGNGEGGRVLFGGTAFDRASLGSNVLGKVYHYTIQEIVPEGWTDKDGQKVYNGVAYDDTVRDLFVYVHLHGSDGNPLTSGTVADHVDGVVLNADASGDRESIFRNVYTTAPVTVDLGGDGADGSTPVNIVKTLSGRAFTAGDSFTFDLVPGEGTVLLPKDAENHDVTEVTITPTSGSSANVPFGKITFTAAGVYTYKLTERQGSAPRMTYDTAEKTLTITVTDVDGQLTASSTGVTWANSYKKSGGGGGGGGGGGFTPRPSGTTNPATPAKLDTSDHFAYILGKSDGLVHPEANITRAEVATVFYRLLTEESRKELWVKENPYPDVPSSEWCNIAVSVMSNAGVIKGRLNGKFDPYANITRGEFATIAARFLSDPYVGEDYYTDISAHWAREYINRAAAAGWVRDFDQPFRPNDYITRAEVMSLVNAMIGRTPDKDHMHEDMIQWPDNMDTTKWYYEDVQEATNSHEYVRIQGGMENWTKVLPVRDWKAIEAEWASIYDATNPGDVMDGVRTKS